MRGRRGMTLVELLIAITVVTIVTAAMTRLLVFTARADEIKNAQREARGVSRAAINLLESELRMVDPFGVLAPTNDSTLTVRVPYAFGLVCNTGGGSARVSFLPSFEVSAALNTPGHTGWAWRNVTSEYIYENNASIGLASAAVCAPAQIDTYGAQGGVVVELPTTATIRPGTVAFLYREMTYSLRASTTFPGRRALYRTAGPNGTPEELAAPFSAGSRFRFYSLNNLLPHDSVTTFLDNLRGVQFLLNGESVQAARNSAAVARAPFVTAVFFQNRPS